MDLKQILGLTCKYLGISIGSLIIVAVALAVLAGYGYNWYIAVTAHDKPWWVYWANWDAVISPLISIIWGILTESFSFFTIPLLAIFSSSVAIANLVNAQKEKVDKYFWYPLVDYPLSSPDYSGGLKFLWFLLIFGLAANGIFTSITFSFLFFQPLKFFINTFWKFLKFIYEDKNRLFLVFFWFLNIITLFYSVVYSIQLADEIKIDWPSWMLVETSGSTITTVLFVLLLTFLPLLQLTIKFLPKLSLKKRENKNDYWEKIKGFCKNFVKIINGIKDFVTKEKNNYFAKCLWFFEWLYFGLSVVGIVIAIQYTKTGSLISVVSTVEQRINEKARDWFKEKDNEDTKLLDLLLMEEGKLELNNEKKEELKKIKKELEENKDKNLKEVLLLKILNLESFLKLEKKDKLLDFASEEGKEEKKKSESLRSFHLNSLSHEIEEEKFDFSSLEKIDDEITVEIPEIQPSPSTLKRRISTTSSNKSQIINNI